MELLIRFLALKKKKHLGFCETSKTGLWFLIFFMFTPKNWGTSIQCDVHIFHNWSVKNHQLENIHSTLKADEDMWHFFYLVKVWNPNVWIDTVDFGQLNMEHGGICRAAFVWNNRQTEKCCSSCLPERTFFLKGNPEILFFKEIYILFVAGKKDTPHFYGAKSSFPAFWIGTKNCWNLNERSFHRYRRHRRKCLKDPWFIFDAVLVVRVPGLGVSVDLNKKPTPKSCWKTRQTIFFWLLTTQNFRQNSDLFGVSSETRSQLLVGTFFFPPWRETMKLTKILMIVEVWGVYVPWRFLFFISGGSDREFGVNCIADFSLLKKRRKGVSLSFTTQNTGGFQRMQKSYDMYGKFWVIYLLLVVHCLGWCDRS